MSYGTPEPKGAPARQLRVLVAEDFPVNQQIAIRQIEKLGHMADAADNGLLALEALKRAPYDVVLMDCHMPEMDGFEATWQIRDWEKNPSASASPHKRPYIIAMTTSTDDNSRQKCLDAGMDDYISKPVHLTELEAALERSRQDEETSAVVGGVIDPVVIAGLRQLREPGKPDPLVQVIDLFLQDAPTRLVAIQDAIARNDAITMSQIINAAISLKGGAGNLGARKLAMLCRDIERQVWQGTFADVLPLVEHAQAEFNRVRAALEKIKVQSR